MLEIDDSDSEYFPVNYIPKPGDILEVPVKDCRNKYDPYIPTRLIVKEVASYFNYRGGCTTYHITFDTKVIYDYKKRIKYIAKHSNDNLQQTINTLQGHLNENNYPNHRPS